MPDSTTSDQNQPDSSEIWAVVPAAGSGTRLPSNFPKQYLQLKGKSILQRAIDTLLQLNNLKGVVVVLAPNDKLWAELPASDNPKILTVPGGNTRAESVVAGLDVVCKASQNDAMVLVHDAARALTALSDMERLIEQVLKAPDQGGMLASRVQDTLKRALSQSESAQSDQRSAYPCIGKTVSRDDLWHAQTPQMFRARDLRAALLDQQDAVSRGEITDEACAMEKVGCSPVLVEALRPNFKITRATDLDMALALIELSEREQVS